jgi:hypothetical protein
MKFNITFAFVLCLVAVTLTPDQATAQQLLPGEREAVVTAIPGVIAAGAKWQLIWADFKTADGIVGSPDGGVLFAQEQSDSIRKLDVNDKEFIYVTDTHGAGSVSLDAQGRLFAVQRTCTDPGKPFNASCQELRMIGILAPGRADVLGAAYCEIRAAPSVGNKIVESSQRLAVLETIHQDFASSAPWRTRTFARTESCSARTGGLST